MPRCLLVLHLKIRGATELKRILDCATNTDNLAFTLVVHVSTFIGQLPTYALLNDAVIRGKTIAHIGT